MKSKKIRSLFVVIAVICCSLFVLPSVQAAQPTAQPDKIRVGYFTFASFQDVDKSGRYSGYGYEYLQALEKYTGWQYEYVFASWDECLTMLEKGEIDLLGSAQYTEERAKVFDYAKLESGISYAVLCASSENRELAYEDFEAFDGMTVGLLKGNSRNDRLEEYCRENGFRVTTKLYDNQENLINALHSDQVDTILTSNLRKDEGERIVARFAPSPFYFVTTKGNKQVLDQLNYAQSQIKLADPYFDIKLYEKFYSVAKTDRPVFTQTERQYIKDHPVIRASYNPEWGPLEHKNLETGQFEGIVADIFTHLQASTGLKFEYTPAEDLKRAAELLQAGKIDVICAYNKDYESEQSDQVNLTNSYLTSINVMVTDPRHADKNVHTIAITPDFLPSFQQRLREEGRAELRYYPTAKACFEALRKGEVGSVYVDSYVADLLRGEYQYSRFHVTAMANLKDELCIGVLEQSDPRLLSILNKAVQHLSEEKMQEIIIENTTLSNEMSLKEMIYQNPVQVIVVIAGTLILFILFLSYILFLRNRNNKRIYRLLYLDDLTGIWNFNYFRKEMQQFLSTERQGQYALVYMDIERFKDINDKFGYAQGDLILKGIGEVLRESVGTGELYARVANDSFIALLRYYDEAAFIDRLKDFLYKMNQIQKKGHDSFKLQITSGVYLLDPKEKEASNAIDCANDARKTIKGARKSNYMFFSDQLKNALLAEREIEAVMERALEEGEFVAYYQPKVELKTLTTIGAEALVRWLHPQRGLIPPDHFIPLFEKNGFIVEMDFYIFECVCKMIRSQMDSGRTPVVISSNFSRVHFNRPDFISRLREIVDRYQIPQHLLELEITESIADENPEQLLSLLEELKHAGFLLAMDDFGSGYSSLNLLKKLPVDTLKLDKDFMQKGIVNEKDRIIIEGFIDIAQKLKITVVCEGVETEAQAAFLKKIGCDLAQGYLYARPMPQNKFEQHLFLHDEK